jgi:methylisocitrate lyase
MTMTDQADRAEQFAALHVRGNPVILFNVWDAGSAKAVAGAGARAIATGSWSVASANGFADGEQFPLAAAIENLKRIVKATDLPVTVDLEAGYGATPPEVGETIAMAIEAGAIGCNLEDSYPENGTLRPMTDQVERIRRRQPISAFSSTPARTCSSRMMPRCMMTPWSMRRSNGGAPMRKPVPAGSLCRASSISL